MRETSGGIEIGDEIANSLDMLTGARLFTSLLRGEIVSVAVTPPRHFVQTLPIKRRVKIPQSDERPYR
jgi:hypothetical protein